MQSRSVMLPLCQCRQVRKQIPGLPETPFSLLLKAPALYIYLCFWLLPWNVLASHTTSCFYCLCCIHYLAPSYKWQQHCICEALVHTFLLSSQSLDLGAGRNIHPPRLMTKVSLLNHKNTISTKTKSINTTVSQKQNLSTQLCAIIN